MKLAPEGFRVNSVFPFLASPSASLINGTSLNADGASHSIRYSRTLCEPSFEACRRTHCTRTGLWWVRRTMDEPSPRFRLRCTT